jgi:hypothetical protein
MNTKTVPVLNIEMTDKDGKKMMIDWFRIGRQRRREILRGLPADLAQKIRRAAKEMTDEKLN